jgi:hypothetical protein
MDKPSDLDFDKSNYHWRTNPEISPSVGMQPPRSKDGRCPRLPLI